MGVGSGSISAYGQFQDLADALLGLTYAGQSSDFSGADTITLEVADAGGLTASSIVRIDVEAASPPRITRAGRLASLSRNLRVDEDGELSLDTLHISVSNSETASLVQVEISCTNGIVSLPLSDKEEAELRTRTATGQGVILAGITDRVNRALRSLMYRPDADVWGTDQLSIVAREGSNGYSDTGGWNTMAGIESILVLIDPVNDPPTIRIPIGLADGVFPTAFAGEIFPFGSIEVGDADAENPRGSQLVSVNASVVVEGTMLSLAMGNTTVEGRIPGVRFLEGSLTVSGALAEVSRVLAGTTYVPEPDFHGAETLVLSAQEHRGDWAMNASVEIIVFAQPDPPTITVGSLPMGLTAEEGSRMVLQGVKVQHVDALDDCGSGTVTFRAHSIAGRGTITMNETQAGLWVYTEEVGGALVARGSFERVNTMLERLHFSPSADFFGPVEVNIEINDGGASGRGGVLWATSSMFLEVTPVNDPPSV
ncbi:unnamed protein product, partial [Hapterophycus canaliculatus]